MSVQTNPIQRKLTRQAGLGTLAPRAVGWFSHALAVDVARGVHAQAHAHRFLEIFDVSDRATVCHLAIATSRELDAIQADDIGLVETLDGLGVESTSAVWNDTQVDWSAFDAVLIRTVWDYYKHHAAFVGWLNRLDRLGVPTINDSALLRWNSDKRYLLELADHGVDIIPTRLAAHVELAGMLAKMPGQRVVIKPAISGGAWHTVQGTVGDARFDEAVAQLPPEHDYLVQPFLPEIVSDGEWSLLYFGGHFSHAVIKRPAAGDFRVQSEFGGSVASAQPDGAMLAAAHKALVAVTAIGHREAAYVRVDGVIGDRRFLIMELELIEPFLFLGTRAGAAEQLARAVAERLQPPHPSIPPSAR
jgi:glutathione synthase/RimK-type ligase-like ATP-grasp enzyme